jgi:hypothetical protein
MGTQEFDVAFQQPIILSMTIYIYIYIYIYTERTFRCVRRLPFEICFISRMHMIRYIWHPFRSQRRWRC